MMKASVYRVLDKLNELEKKAERMSDKAYNAEQEGKTKTSEHYEKDADDIRKEIKGMVSCLKLLGFNAWRQCDRDTDYLGVWHIPLDDIENIC